ncbi:hypothetical protein [Zavarzinia aquatilis]|uniref:Uncharacterized protein n=1 Tax=Zavarzinia aquatilis TaxID=2211142 RepID=A0A317E7P3_9PROT|nr:hypothetical protein [Zavarzinia aquatilis]PWR22959.1 hypothetical protein DKG74_11140 [Zavarzinia aquatilis]
MRRQKKSSRRTVFVAALALGCGACTSDTLPKEWAPEESDEGCGWISLRYHAKGTSASSVGQPPTVPLVFVLQPGVVDGARDDYKKPAEVDVVALEWRPGESVLRVDQIGSGVPPFDLNFVCEQGQLKHEATGPSNSKDWVGVGGEDIVLWRAPDGALVIHNRQWMAMAIYMMLPLAGGSSWHGRFEPAITP